MLMVSDYGDDNNLPGMQSGDVGEPVCVIFSPTIEKEVSKVSYKKITLMNQKRVKKMQFMIHFYCNLCRY